MTKALRDRLKAGQVYEVTNYYISRPDHPAFGTRVAVVTDVNSTAFRLDGNRIPFPKQAQTRLHDDGTIELLGGGVSQQSDDLFLALVPVAPDSAAAQLEGARTYRNATMSGPVAEPDLSTLFAQQHVWTLTMPVGGPKRLVWPEGNLTFSLEQQDPAGNWLSIDISQFTAKVSDGTLDTASRQVEGFLAKVNATLEINTRRAQQLAINKGVEL